VGSRRRSLWSACVLVAALTTLTAAVASAMPEAAADATTSGGWRLPVDGKVVRPFAEPSSAYGPGHRGVDLAAPSGTAVRAAGAGTVTFAGDVAGALHVVVTHRNGLRTSYSFLADVTVAVGDTVDTSTVVGHSGGSDPDSGHGADMVHFGLRVGERYVDPLLLFQTRDLTELVRLVPVEPLGPDGSWEHASVDEPTALELGVGHQLVAPNSTDDGCADGVPLLGGTINAICDGVDWAAGATEDALRVGLDVLEGAGREGAALAARLRPELRDLLDDIRAATAPVRALLLNTPPGRVLRDVVEIGQRMIEWATQHCDRHSPAANGTGGSGHALIAVSGIDSSWDGRDRHTFDLDTDALGYDRDDVHWFSYAERGGAYGRDDTHRSLYKSAELLAAQLREQQAREPGREVDLVAHSQGGVVVDIFLKFLYEPSDPTFPPLGPVVSLASPHQGAPLARSGEALRSNDTTRHALDVVDAVNDRVGPFFPPSDSKAVRQLNPDSELMRRLRSTPLPDDVHYVSIGSTDDWVVPANRIHLDGATEVVVDVDGYANDHDAIPRDANALRAVRAALEQRPPPCTSLMAGIRSSVEPVLLSRVEGDLGETVVTALEVGR
jgi:hypothetical protein